MSKSPDNEQKNEYQKILEKVESQSKQRKNERTFNILKGQKSKNTSYQRINYFQIAQNFYEQKRFATINYFKRKQTRHTAIMTVFLVFSTYLCYVIQRKYDTLKKKAKKTQTYKQIQVQKQNEYIQKMLRKRQFQSVPIPNQLEQQNAYKYTQAPASLTIDTKQDLMQLLEQDKATTGQFYKEQAHRNRQHL